MDKKEELATNVDKEVNSEYRKLCGVKEAENSN